MILWALWSQKVNHEITLEQRQDREKYAWGKAKGVLKRGDRVRMDQCGRSVTVTIDLISESGKMYSKTGIDIYPQCIFKVNGVKMKFTKGWEPK